MRDFTIKHRHHFAQSQAYPSGMKEPVKFGDSILQLKSAATPATRKVLQFGTGVYLISVAIVIGVWCLRAFLTFGIHTHPPIWLIAVAHLFAILGALIAAYAFAYITPLGKWVVAMVVGAICYAFTFASIAWGLPSLTVYFYAKPVTIEAKIYGSSNISRGRFLGCRQSVNFGPWYAPGGRVCVNAQYPRVLIGSTMLAQGYGNQWATRVTKIEGYRD